MKRSLLCCSIALLTVSLTSCHFAAEDPADPWEEEVVEPTWRSLDPVGGQPLEDDEIDALLERLTDREAVAAQEVAFKRRDDSLPPPLTGDDIEGDWPPPPGDLVAQPEADGSLTVQAFRPTGEVEPPFQVAVVFDRPVIELGSVSTRDISAFDISPDVEGRWRWIGTQSAIFEPQDRWPMATEFTIAVGPDLEAVDGTELDEKLEFAFTTPAPHVDAIYPGEDDLSTRHYPWNWDSPDSLEYGGRPTDSPVAVIFNQAVDPASAEAITVRQEESGRVLPMELAGRHEARQLAEEGDFETALAEDRALVVAPLEDYEEESRVVVEVRGPLRSTEGPVTAMAHDSETFRVGDRYEPFELRSVSCRIKGRPCAPQDGLWLDFNHPVDFDASDIEVEADPPVEDLRVRRYGTRRLKEVVDDNPWRYTTSRSIRAPFIGGDFETQTDYTITVSGEVYDVFGQKLSLTHSQEISFGAHRSGIGFPRDHFFTRPADSAPHLHVGVREMESLRVRVFDVTPADFPTFQQVVDDSNREVELEPVDDRRVRIPEGERQEFQMLPVDYSAALDGDNRGQALVIVDESEPFYPRFRWPRPPRMYWVQHTDLLTDISTDGRQISARVTDVGDGAPVDGASLTVAGQPRARTDASGLAQFSVPTGDAARSPLVVERGGDSLVIPSDGRVRMRRYPREVVPWSYEQMETDLLWYVVDDRQIYRPGEVGKLRGWLRSLERSPRSEPVAREDYETVEYRIIEPRGNEIATGEVDVDAFGGFELDFEVTEEANMGPAHVTLSTTVDDTEYEHTHWVRFEEFRRPEYEVSVESEEGPHFPAHSAEWTVVADYYAGGAVADAPTTWRFAERAVRFQPSGWSGWTFGEWRPWWRSRAADSYGVLTHEVTERREAQTDPFGRNQRTVGFQEPERGFAHRVTGRAWVTDVNRQTWTDSSSVLVHPASVYVGLRSERRFISEGQPLEVEAVAVDLDGDVVEDRPIEITVTPRDEDDADDDADRCTLRSQREPVQCSFSDLTPGRYLVRATVEDARGRISESETSVWVTGFQLRDSDSVEEDELVLIPERDDFAVGDTARFVVQAPSYPMRAVVDLRRDGIYDRKEVVLTEDDPIVEFDVEESMIPNVHVRVLATGMGDSYRIDRYATGWNEITVDRSARRLDVEVEPVRERLSWGEEAEVKARVVDAAGEPVEGAQVLLFAVDEAVLALTNYHLADPVAAFYPRRPGGVDDFDSRQWIVFPGDEDVRMYDRQIRQELSVGAAQGAGGTGYGAGAADVAGAAGAAAVGDVTAREAFDALAFYRSDLITDADGRVSITEQMPDSMTRYRVRAVAVDGDRYSGTGASDITVNRPLMVRPSPPRFLNVGDRFDFPVVVHNRGDEAATISVAMRASDGLEWIEAPGRRVEVPADDRVEVRVAARATSAGTAEVEVVTTTEELSDAVVATIPVLTPATTEAFATYGSIDAGDDDAVLQALQVPDDAYSEHGGLEVSASSTQLQALTDAFIYLVNYRFQCSEQIASRILSVLALYDVLDAFDAADLPPPQELQSSMNQWIDDLIAMQHWNGGFRFWPGVSNSSPYNSAHATLALWRAKDEGYNVPFSALSRADEYLGNMSEHVAKYSPRAAGTVEAYALHVRHRMGNAERRDVDELIGRYGIDELSMEALGWLLPMAEGTQFEERILQRITDQVQETAATAEFQETYTDDAHRILHTTRRTDGVVLHGLMHVDPDHYLIEKVARGLLSHRSRGRWANTQENVFILKALRRYFDTFESTEPDFVARAWLGDDQIAEHAFVGRTTERYSVDVPMSFLYQSDSNGAVVLQRDGEGRMYYRLGMSYAPTSRDVSALNQGFSVERRYKAIDDEDDVRRTDDGWEIKAGARVQVVLTMTIPARRYHVALVDWLPAGLEAVNTELEVSDVEADLVGGSADQRRWSWFDRPWVEHENLRDERVEAFSSLVHEGGHTYSYVARATTPGEFVAMPAKAEEMYHPETFGRTSTEIVRVVE